MNTFTDAQWARIEQLARSAALHRDLYRSRRSARLPHQAERNRAALEGYYAPALRHIADDIIAAGYAATLAPMLAAGNITNTHAALRDSYYWLDATVDRDVAQRMPVIEVHENLR